MSSRYHNTPASNLEKSRIIERTRRAILKNGRNATAYQIINHGIQRWFYRDAETGEDALIGYVCKGKTGVAAGEPVCKEKDIQKIVRLFQEHMQQHSSPWTCWFCASPVFARQFQNKPGYAIILIGAQPVWNPQYWKAEVHKHPTLRKQLNRARNKGVVVREWTAQKATNHPALLQCLSEWLEARPFPALHFLVEPQTLDRLYDRRIFVAERSAEPIGFVILSPVPYHNGWLVEQIIRGSKAPNGTSELMVDFAAQVTGEEKYEYLTLGLAPLSRRSDIQFDNTPGIRFLLGWIRLHGKRFYNFDGLDYFKSKFVPQSWEPVYAVVNRRRFSLRTFYAVAAAFSNGSPLRALAIGSWKAVRQELRWLKGRLQSVWD